MSRWFFIIFFFVSFARAQTNIKIVLLTEIKSESVTQQIADVVRDAEKRLAGKAKINLDPVPLTRDDEEGSLNLFCDQLNKGISLIVDLTWSGWYESKEISEKSGVPYVRVDITIRPFVKAVDDFLMKRNGTDSALIFENEDQLDQALYYMIGYSTIRIIVLDKLGPENLKGLYDMRPTPSFHSIFGSTKNVLDMFQTAYKGNIVQREGRWNLVFMDFNKDLWTFDNMLITENVLTPKLDICCALENLPAGCQCPADYQIVPSFLRHFGLLLSNIFIEMVEKLEARPVDCKTVSADKTDNSTRDLFFSLLRKKVLEITPISYENVEAMIYYRMAIDIAVGNKTVRNDLATWNTEDGFLLNPGKVLEEDRRFFRIGVIDDDEPWSYLVTNPETGEEVWTGYCIDLAKKLAQEMKFDFEFSKPKEGRFGKKLPSGKWNGLVGDLAKGETDIVIAALMMTSEREEVIDFVAPYFDQSGILIMMRKPIRPTSLFKFMTVLRPEVWFSIVGALTVTGIMIWLLDKYSPYSARNNKEMYPYPCREFTLKESFWFALTSFTPQGGGEAPKALSGRTLVAAYWLFVVLMLATFTANLAAFLTVERMKSPVESLEQLARQSRINYTVVKNGDTHQFFKNMKLAEDTLYQKWKELTLNASSDQTQYRVWDYPIKEQYGHILLAIEQTGPVENESVGIQKVLENPEFAFIHDAAAIRYQVSKNCNLTEVGEVFAERPYAVAVQQGSQLQEEISRKILDLQKDRYFETESAKYWNPTAAGKCPNTDDSEGITLGSLGGVFIATLFGLALAMVTLAGEIFYHKHKNKIDQKLQELRPWKKSHGNVGEKKPAFKPEDNRVTLGTQDFIPAFPKTGKTIPKVSYISVFPRGDRIYD